MGRFRDPRPSQEERHPSGYRHLVDRCDTAGVVEVSVSRATGNDGELAITILADGFRDDPVMSWIFPDQATRQQALTGFFDALVAGALMGLDATYLRGEDSCAVWVPPGSEDPWAEPGFADKFLRRMSGLADEATLERLLVLGAMTGEQHPAEPHHYLAMLATRVSAQGQGCGTTLLRHTLAVVDAAEAPAYLESTNPANVSLYERHGFSVTGRIDLPDGPPLLPMWRPATGAERT
jgi:ribosomal protein S18 acetylase RimI-like enzyme